MLPFRPSWRTSATALVVSGVVAATGLAPGPGGQQRSAAASPVTPPPGWVDHLNQMRADYGSAPVTIDPALSSASQQHALYMAEHGTLTHDQVPGRARHTAAGRAAAQRSLLAGPAARGEDTPDEFVDLWARGAFSALAMLHPGVVRIGYGQAELGASDYAALDVHSSRSAPTATTGWPRTWPSARRSVGVRTYAGSESPDPVRGCGAAPPTGWGLPLLVSYGPGPRPTGATASLSVDGTAVPVCVVSAHGNADPTAVARLDEAHSVVVVPREPLRAGRTYTGSVTSSRGAVPLRFSVAPDGATAPPVTAVPQPPSAQPAAAAWQRLPGAVRDVGVARDGSAWAIGTTAVGGGYNILRWTGTAWASVPGGAVDVDVDGAGQAWIVNSTGAIYRRTATAWQRLPGAARAVGVAADGTAWVLGRRPLAGGFTIHRWTGSGWATVPGAAVALDVDAAGRPWIVNSAGAIYRRTATGWQRLPGAARAVGVGGDGRAWVVGRTAVPGGYGVHRWTGSGWVSVPGAALRLDVDGAGRAWIVNTAGGVLRRTTAG